ncbi:Uncharacterized protein C1orf158-like protein [Trichoplax sp. H2]|nr:Uncharacterized protein C1orf158-like protein [Trichoplax sp. H2]|eukprot:RDD39114.1 Uncharacterized protein C1orf158-like protein [Trichoplax sp. H2]
MAASGQPSWKVESRFKNGVLIGNWYEERMQYQRENFNHSSTQRHDYKPYGNAKPDTFIRRAALARNNGLNKQQIFFHHGKKYNDNMISYYDQVYNKRDLEHIPTNRRWDLKRIAWLPEKSDVPIYGNATKFGLLEKKKEQWKKEVEEENRGIYSSETMTSFAELPKNSLITKHQVTPKHISSRMHPHHLNKDLALRSLPIINPVPQIVSWPHPKFSNTLN